MKTNWAALFKEITGRPASEGGIISGNDGTALAAKLIGDDVIREAVDYTIIGGEAWGLTAILLQVIKPRAGIDRCYEWWENKSASLDERLQAASLLADMPDRRSISICEALIKSDDPSQASFGIKLLTSLARNNLVSLNEVEAYLSFLKTSNNREVLEMADDIEWLRDMELPTFETIG